MELEARGYFFEMGRRDAHAKFGEKSNSYNG